MIFNRYFNLALSAASLAKVGLVLSLVLILAIATVSAPGWCGDETTQQQDLTALKEIDVQLRKKPGDVTLLCKHAEMMGRLHRYDDELKEASEIIKSNPRSRDAFLIQAHGFGNLERSGDAIKSLDTAFSLGAPTPELLVLKATHLRREKRYAEAVKILSKVIDDHPDYSAAYDCRSVCYYRLYGPCKLALDDLEHESRLEPQNEETKKLIQELKRKLATP